MYNKEKQIYIQWKRQLHKGKTMAYNEKEEGTRHPEDHAAVCEDVVVLMYRPCLNVKLRVWGSKL